MKTWAAEALNTAPDSKNEIHGDKLAKEFGFKGGLVPGVTISAYLLHPVIEKWGIEWLNNGFAKCMITSPLYDKEKFEVISEEVSEEKILTTLYKSDQTISANAEAALSKNSIKPPKLRGDTIVSQDYVGPQATKDIWEKLKKEGCFSFRYLWGGENPLIYLRDLNQLPDLLNPKKDGFANLCFLLGCSNWILASNAYMNPWIHLQTKSHNFRAVPMGTSLIAEMQVKDCYDKKGHEFIDVDVNLFDERDEECIMMINLLAIYKVRGA